MCPIHKKSPLVGNKNKKSYQLSNFLKMAYSFIAGVISKMHFILAKGMKRWIITQTDTLFSGLVDFCCVDIKIWKGQKNHLTYQKSSNLV